MVTLQVSKISIRRSLDGVDANMAPKLGTSSDANAHMQTHTHTFTGGLSYWLPQPRSQRPENASARESAGRKPLPGNLSTGHPCICAQYRRTTVHLCTYGRRCTRPGILSTGRAFRASVHFRASLHVFARSGRVSMQLTPNCLLGLLPEARVHRLGTLRAT